MRRRTFVWGAIPLCSGLAGCSGLFSDSTMLSVTVFNYSENPYTIELTLSRTDENLSRSDARVFSGRIGVDPDGQTIREEIAERQQYLIEYWVFEDNSALTDQGHVHYYPGDEDESGSLAFNIDSSGTLTRR